MAHPLDLSILRIYDKNGNVVGVGFLVDDRRVLTCVHVIEAALRLPGNFQDMPAEAVKMDFPLLEQQKICFARVTHWDKASDVAGLELTSDPPIGASPVRLVSAEDVWDHKFRAFGFPQNYADRGVWANGVLKHKVGSKEIQIEGEKETGQGIQPGFSGAPVWDESLQGVIGMVSAADTDMQRKVAFCIPYNVLSAWPEIQNKVSDPKRKAHFFLSYKRSADPDQKLADYLAENLQAHGHTAFIDATMRMGEDWLERIDNEIKQSAFLVVLLSNESANSEMVRSEVRRAYEYRKINGRPQILPIRIAYRDLLPYSIEAFLNPLQYMVWEQEGDEKQILEELVQAAQGQLPVKPLVEIQPANLGGLSEDGRTLVGEKIMPPLPQVDPRILDELKDPTGAVKLRDKFYVEREADARLKKEITQAGTTVTIRAARQTGKSSLLVRGIQHAQQAGQKVVHLDVQRVAQDYLATMESFTRYLAEYILFKLELGQEHIERHWRSGLGPQDKLTYLIEDCVLDKFDRPVVLAMDEIDRLLQTQFYGDFFALLRSWHNNRASDERWDRLNIAMVISTEPYMLISDTNQSPFNVGTNLYLEDFKDAQVRDLNARHGSPISEVDFPRFVELLGGHPYLTRKALYTLVTEKMSWNAFENSATLENGPFGDHLRHYLWLIQSDEKLKEALKRVVQGKGCPETEHRLLRAGLVKASGDFCKCRCDLYRIYFENKL